MNLLLNEWKTFLEDDKEKSPANTNLQWNANKIQKLSQEGWWRDWTTIFAYLGIEYDTNIDRTEEIQKALVGVDPLVENKIVQLLGTGTMGAVFELDNGHALKLFRGGYLSGFGSGVEEEMKFYASSKEKLFSKEAGLHTLPVYDYGKGSSGIYWVEMAKLMIFSDYMELTGRPPAGTLLQRVIEYLVGYADEYNWRAHGGKYSSREEVNRDKLMWIKFEASRLKYTLRELKSLMETVRSALEEYDESYVADLHVDNLGVLETSTFRHGAAHDKQKIIDPTRTPRFVLFDP